LASYEILNIRQACRPETQIKMKWVPMLLTGWLKSMNLQFTHCLMGVTLHGALAHTGSTNVINPSNNQSGFISDRQVHSKTTGELQIR